MADKQASDDRLDETSQADLPADEQDDTEGHLLMPNISAARAISSERSSTAERNARIRVRQREERPGDKRQR